MDSFLPRIQSVFYAVFDLQQGPKIVYQVPEGLIAVNQGSNGGSNGASVPPTPSTDTSPVPSSGSTGNGLMSRNSSTSLVSPTELYRPGRYLMSPLQRGASSSSSQRTLFHFNDISMYVIPHPSLCGRLVTFSTRRYRIIGFPVELKGKYKRNYFRYNLCFVFDRGADLSCYEPIVRKVSRVLKSCEEESAFLSSPQTSPNVHLILEQLYEDLNSYSETSIAIDRFNSIELKIFPFYPNPPAVKDWMVPLALINLTKRVEENWDLTMVKVCKYIDGVNHVSRIAHLADCDITFTRKAIAHLLYYQVIMTIDIFQFSNMYTLRKSVQWLADEPHVKEECGPYVTKPGRPVPDWPKLLHLYSRLRPGKTVFEWMQAYEVESLGIDVRRFTSFGVIKGFLRRVHRYPVYTPPDPSLSIASLPPEAIPQPTTLMSQTFNPISESTLARKRGKSLTNGGGLRLSGFNNPFSHQQDSSTSSAATGSSTSTLMDPSVRHGSTMLKGAGGVMDGAHQFPTTTSMDATLPNVQSNASAVHRARRASAAEKVLEHLQSRLQQKSGTVAGGSATGVVPGGSQRASWINYQTQNMVLAESGGGGPPNSAAASMLSSITGMSGMGVNASGNPSGWDAMGSTPSTILASSTSSTAQESPSKSTGDREGGYAPSRGGSGGVGRSESRRQSLISPAVPPPSPVMPKLTLLSSTVLPPSGPPTSATTGGSNSGARPTNRLSRTPSVSQVMGVQTNGHKHPPNANGQYGEQGVVGSGGGLPPGIAPQLIPLLDGDHHTDEISVKFGVGWPCLEAWLSHLGGAAGASGNGNGNGSGPGLGSGSGEVDLGAVQIIYR